MTTTMHNYETSHVRLSGIVPTQINDYNLTTETQSYFDPITGVWYAGLGLWVNGSYVLSFTSKGYQNQRTAKQQATRLYNTRFNMLKRHYPVTIIYH